MSVQINMHKVRTAEVRDHRNPVSDFVTLVLSTADDSLSVYFDSKAHLFGWLTDALATAGALPADDGCDEFEAVPA